ncbi:MAG TPA: flagellar filament capping protein FliD [Dehalococcoidia bacterium]|nr:flagellar filament capping protein FliD [Dehalococcoidia bacterium]
MVSFGNGTSAAQPVTLTGLVSGLNTASLIQQIQAADKAKLQPIQNQISQQKTIQQAYTNLNSNLSALLSTVQSFSSASYLQGATANVLPGGASPTVSATANAGATPGSFKVTVNHLATATNVASPGAIGAAIDPNATLQSDKLAIAIQAGTFTVNGAQVTIDPTVDTLNSVIAKIQAAAPGTTAQLVNDASGRPNLLQISNPGGVQLGTGGDTSNFLAAMSLLASPTGNTRTSTANLGVVQTGATLQSANLSTPLNAGTGSFTVNGVTINWDASKDSLSTVLSEINNSSAGVTAMYNPANDTVAFVSKSTGSTAIQLQDTSGNFLAAIGVGGTTQTLGSNAQFQIDTGTGPTTYYSTTNTVHNAVPGVTLNLLQQNGATDTVTVGQDTNGALANINQFIAQINGTLDLIAQNTSASTSSTPTYTGQQSSSTPQNGPLAGDYDIQQIGYKLHQVLAGTIQGNTGGYTSLSQIGISFGPVGSAAGTTNHLQLNQQQFLNALQTNPSGVANLFSAFGAAGTLQPGGANIASTSGTPSSVRSPGSVNMTTVLNGDGSATVTAIFTPSNGSPATTTVASHVTPGSSNTTLVPGMTLTFNGALQAGTDTINITTPTLGFEAQLEQLLTPLTGSGGVLSTLQNDSNRAISDLNSQLTTMNTTLQNQTSRLQDEFTKMELALQQLNQQKNSLSTILSMQSQVGL